MQTDITQVKNLIYKDSEAMNYFLLIAIYYALHDDDKSPVMKYEDFKLYKFVIDSYNKKTDKLEEFLENSENDRYKDGLDEFYTLIEREKEELLNNNDIDIMLSHFYLFAYNEALNTHIAFAKMFYLMNKYKNTNFESELKEYILDFINFKKYNDNIDINKAKMTIKQYKRALKYLKLEGNYYYLSPFYMKYGKGGDYSQTTINNLVSNSVKEDYYFFNKWERNYLEFERLQAENKELTKEDYYIADTLEEQMLFKIKNLCSKNIKEATIYHDITTEITKKLEELSIKEDLDISLSNAEQQQLRKQIVKKIADINNYDSEDTLKLSTITDYFTTFAFDYDIKDYLIDNTILEYADERELKEQYISRYKHAEVKAKKSKKARKKSQLEHALTNDMIKTSNEWLKVNNNKYNRGILNARDEIATYQETNLERQERELQELQDKYKKTHNKAILEDIEDKKLDYEENKKKFDDLCNEIKDKEEELSDLRRIYQETNESDYLKLLKKKDKEVKELKKKRDNRGLNIQLDMNSNDLVINKEGVKLSISFDKFNINNYNSEGKRLLVYIQNQLYYNPTNDYIILDLDEYLEQTGRKLSTARSVRKKVKSNLESAYEESYELPLKDVERERELTGKIRLFQEFWEDKYKGKLTYYIKLTDAYKRILLSDKTMKWASIPILLNKLNGTKAEDRARELGFYLYQILRIDLKNQKIGCFYKKNFKMKTFADLLFNKGLNNNYETYAKNIITPLEDALNRLEDLGFIEYNTNAFLNYEGYYKENKEGNIDEFIKGTIGTNENNIKSIFEEEDILITYKIADYVEYDRIINKREKKITTKPRKKIN